MTEKAILIDWIHRVEFDPKKTTVFKRLPGLVTEIFFEKFLSGCPELELPKPISLGWTYKRIWNNPDRLWFKFSEGGVHSSISRAFIRSIKNANPRDRFFLVIPKVMVLEDGPQISWAIFELVVTDVGNFEKSLTIDAGGFRKQIEVNVERELLSRRNVNVAKRIGGWLKSLTLEELKWLFSFRCLMNFSGLYLSDIDAVAAGPEGEIELMEFKRKDPATGRRHKPLRQIGETAGVSSYLSRIDGFKVLRNKSIAEELADKKRWSPVVGNSFGLDTSHAGNVDLCIRTGMKYRYVIWNSSVSNPEELLSLDWMPLVPLDIRTLSISSEDFDGIASTEGGDSGTYTDKTRFQLMVPVVKFVKHQVLITSLKLPSSESL